MNHSPKLSFAEKAGYPAAEPPTENALAGYRATAGPVVVLRFGVCTALLASYQLNKRSTIEMAEELPVRRQHAVPA